jgi:hypothetical protein
MSIAKLAEHPVKRFCSEAAFEAHLDALGSDVLTISPDPVKVAKEGALYGAVQEQGRL